MRADLILTNARAWTGDRARPWADSLAIRGNHLVAVGEEVSATERLDLGGRLVIPGLWDAHIHYYHWSLGLSQVQLSGCSSLADLLERVRQFMAMEPRDTWVCGWGWNETFWPDPTLPSRHHLDAVTGPDRPCLLYRSDMHSAVANSRALNLAGMLEPDLVVEGGVIDRDPDGQPTGVLRELAISRMQELLPGPSAGQLDRALLAGMERLHRLGITAICDQRLKDQDDGPRALAAYARLNRREQLKLRVSCNVAAHNLPLLEALGVSSAMGDDRLQLGHIKIFADGTLGSRTASMLKPFLPGPFDEHDNCGLALTPREQIEDELQRALAIGFPVSIHAIGDRANRVCLDLFEQARLSGGEPPAIAHRIEHAQTLADSDLGRLAELGITASLQPAHILDDMDTADAYLGERARLAYRFGGAGSLRGLAGFRQRCAGFGCQSLLRDARSYLPTAPSSHGTGGLVSSRAPLAPGNPHCLHAGRGDGSRAPALDWLSGCGETGRSGRARPRSLRDRSPGDHGQRAGRNPGAADNVRWPGGPPRDLK